MPKTKLLRKLDRIERYATTSKLNRLIATPRKYIAGMLYRKVFYQKGSKGVIKKVRTFWGGEIEVLLPGSMDIYLSGGKTHLSEIRLSRFLIRELNENDTFLDIGAHIGFFSLLASEVVTQGTVVSVEASPQTYSLLKRNTRFVPNIHSLHMAISDMNGEIELLEFPVMYAEFNTIEAQQYEKEDWFNKMKPDPVNVPAMTGTDFLEKHQLHPHIIKIDVEGAEERVILGLLKFLSFNETKLVMEFASAERGNGSHVKAEEHLATIGYLPFKIGHGGETERLTMSTAAYVLQLGLDSDNIVYMKEK